MTTTKHQFKKLPYEGLQTLVSWAAEEGWNPGPYDAEVFWATDPDGYHGYYKDNELIAGGSVVSYDGLFGFMGFFIVKPGLRNQGIGRRLWMQRRDHLRSRLQPGAAIGMDGVVAMQPFYKKGGFELAFRDERYGRKGESFTVDPLISAIPDAVFPEILAYDTQCFGVPRPQFLKPWLKLPESHGFMYAKEARIKGYALMRKAGNGYKIGPLFADNYTIAEALYRACLNAASGEEVFLDIPTNNPDAIALVQKYNATYGFECARMYHGTPPNRSWNKVFGITTFELG
jgi:GNAT superfamily N-acetyltransferase